MATYKQVSQIIKQAADRLVELENNIVEQEKESSVNELLISMKEKGLIDDKTAYEKKKELLKSGEAEIEIHKKALELIGSRSNDIATITKKGSEASPESKFDNWVYGGT